MCEERESQQDTTIRCLLSASAVYCTVLASYKEAPHNRYQPHSVEPVQYTICSNTRSLFSWRWA